MIITAREQSLGQGNISEAYVILSMEGVVGDGGGLCMMSLPVWLHGPMFLPGVFVPGLMFFLGVSVLGVSDQRGLCPGGLYRETPHPPIRKAGGRHPTGMLSCFHIYCILSQWRPYHPSLSSSFFFHFHAVFGKSYAK